MHRTFPCAYSLALIAMTLFMAPARADVLVTLTDAGGGTSNMTILASGIVDPVPAGEDGTYFGYAAALNSFRASAEYDNITIPSISTGPGSDPFTKLRFMDFGVDYFQLWTGSLFNPVASPFDLSQMNGTYNVAVDHSLFNVGTYRLSHLSGMNVGDVTLTVAVPEVSSALFVGLGLAGAFIIRSRRKI